MAQPCFTFHASSAMCICGLSHNLLTICCDWPERHLMRRSRSRFVPVKSNVLPIRCCMERLARGCLLLPLMVHVCQMKDELLVDNPPLAFSTMTSEQMNPCLFSNRSGANLAVNDNNGSFISTLSMQLYNVGAQHAPSEGPTTSHSNTTLPKHTHTHTHSQFPSLHKQTGFPCSCFQTEHVVN